MTREQAHRTIDLLYDSESYDYIDALGDMLTDLSLKVGEVGLEQQREKGIEVITNTNFRLLKILTKDRGVNS